MSWAPGEKESRRIEPVLDSLENAINTSLGEIGARLAEKAGADVTVSMTVDGKKPVSELAPSLAGALQLPFSTGEATEHNAVLIVPAPGTLVLASDDPSSPPDELTDEAKGTLGELAAQIAEQVARSSGAASPQLGDPVFDAGELSAGLAAAETVVEFGFATQGAYDIRFSVVAAAEIAAEAAEAGKLDDDAAEPPRAGAGQAEAAEFVPFEQSGASAQVPARRGIDLILDVPLEISVELGRVSMLIKDILSLAPGSIVELGRTAGEPVDLLVNGRLVAKGEVVVIEDNFGIRVTEIVSPADRIAQADDLAS